VPQSLGVPGLSIYVIVYEEFVFCSWSLGRILHLKFLVHSESRKLCVYIHIHTDMYVYIYTHTQFPSFLPSFLSFFLSSFLPSKDMLKREGARNFSTKFKYLPPTPRSPWIFKHQTVTLRACDPVYKTCWEWVITETISKCVQAVCLLKYR
jgi:hypothetical protein